MIRMTPNTKTIIHHQCQRCGQEYPHGYIPRCRSCGGLIEVLYDLDSVKLYDSDIALERFADLMPFRDPTQILHLGEGGTPCVHAAILGEAIGLDRLYLKVENRNPTGTTKDRMAAAVLSLFHELGITEFISSSTGNSSTSLAYGISRYPGFKMHLYVGGAFRERVRYSDGNPGIVLHSLDGLSFADAFDHARSEAQRTGLPFEAGFFNFARREGLKLAYFEATEQVESPIRWYFQAVSSAMGLYGSWKGAKELYSLQYVATLPRLVCVQQETCCPMVRAYQEGSREIQEHHIFHNPTGIAPAILRGNPSACYPYVYDAVVESQGTFVAVGRNEILEAQSRLKESDGVQAGYCGSATVAAVMRLAAEGRIKSDETVLLNLTD